MRLPMGLLAVLDHYYDNLPEESFEIEYRLESWGEIYSPFIGDREHSTAARFILREFPFRLFSVSTPYSEIPQRLCLTFKTPFQTKKIGKVTSSSLQEDETAKEFAALLSLITRRRIFAIGQTRNSGMPVETKSEIYTRSHQQERQLMIEIEPNDIYRMLKNLKYLDRRIAESFIIALRLYHSAIEMMFTEPDFAYLFLVMSLEAISSAVYEKFSIEDDEEIEQYLNSIYPGWKSLCDISTPEKKFQTINMLLSNAYLVQRKFREFIYNYLPEAFWTDTEDNAKPEYISTLIVAGSDGKGKEEFIHSDKTIQEYEKINRNKIKKTLDEIYKARSKLVHEGINLPSNIVLGHYRYLPFDAFSESMTTTSEHKPVGIPPLITLERLVSYTLVEFLNRNEPENIKNS